MDFNNKTQIFNEKFNKLLKHIEDIRNMLYKNNNNIINVNVNASIKNEIMQSILTNIYFLDLCSKKMINEVLDNKNEIIQSILTNICSLDLCSKKMINEVLGKECFVRIKIIQDIWSCLVREGQNIMNQKILIDIVDGKPHAYSTLIEYLCMSLRLSEINFAAISNPESDLNDIQKTSIEVIVPKINN